MRRTAKPDRVDGDSPELTAQWFAKAKPAREILLGLIGEAQAAELLKPKRGRPPLASLKEHVSIRLDSDVVQAFKRKGPSWQTRVNSALREWLGMRSE